MMFPRDLWKAIKQRALDEDTSCTALAEEGLRMVLLRPTSSQKAPCNIVGETAAKSQ